MCAVAAGSSLNENRLTSFNLSLLHLTTQVTTLYVDKSSVYRSFLLAVSYISGPLGNAKHFDCDAIW